MKGGRFWGHGVSLNPTLVLNHHRNRGGRYPERANIPTPATPAPCLHAVTLLACHSM